MWMRFIVASALAPPESAEAEAAVQEPSNGAVTVWLLCPGALVSAGLSVTVDADALLALNFAFFFSDFLEGGAAAAGERKGSDVVAADCPSAVLDKGRALPPGAASIVECDGRCFGTSRHGQHACRVQNAVVKRQWEAGSGGGEDA
jgi:hypothetical protein